MRRQRVLAVDHIIHILKELLFRKVGWYGQGDDQAGLSKTLRLSPLCRGEAGNQIAPIGILELEEIEGCRIDVIRVMACSRRT